MDPRFKNLGFHHYTNFSNAATSIKHELKTLLNSMTPTTYNAHTTNTTSDSFNELQKKKSLGKIYLQISYVFIKYLIINYLIKNCFFKLLL